MFRLGRFVPASVQRDFQWEERQAQELFSDLERVFAAEEAQRSDESEAAAEEGADATIDLAPERDAPEREIPGPLQCDYFLGAMVLRPAPEGRWESFDGLQRLTSLTILLCVLRDLAGATPQGETLQTLIVDADGEFRLALPSKDQTLRDEVQKRGEAGRARRAAPLSDTGGRIRNACTL